MADVKDERTKKDRGKKRKRSRLSEVHGDNNSSQALTPAPEASLSARQYSGTSEASVANAKVGVNDLQRQQSSSSSPKKTKRSKNRVVGTSDLQVISKGSTQDASVTAIEQASASTVPDLASDQGAQAQSTTNGAELGRRKRNKKKKQKVTEANTAAHNPVTVEAIRSTTVPESSVGRDELSVKIQEKKDRKRRKKERRDRNTELLEIDENSSAAIPQSQTSIADLSGILFSQSPAAFSHTPDDVGSLVHGSSPTKRKKRRPRKTKSEPDGQMAKSSVDALASLEDEAVQAISLGLVPPHKKQRQEVTKDEKGQEPHTFLLQTSETPRPVQMPAPAAAPVKAKKPRKRKRALSPSTPAANNMSSSEASDTTALAIKNAISKLSCMTPQEILALASRSTVSQDESRTMTGKSVEATTEPLREVVPELQQQAIVTRIEGLSPIVNGTEEKLEERGLDVERKERKKLRRQRRRESRRRESITVLKNADLASDKAEYEREIPPTIPNIPVETPIYPELLQAVPPSQLLEIPTRHLPYTSLKRIGNSSETEADAAHKGAHEDVIIQQVKSFQSSGSVTSAFEEQPVRRSVRQPLYDEPPSDAERPFVMHEIDSASSSGEDEEPYIVELVSSQKSAGRRGRPPKAVGPTVKAVAVPKTAPRTRANTSSRPAPHQGQPVVQTSQEKAFRASDATIVPQSASDRQTRTIQSVHSREQSGSLQAATEFSSSKPDGTITTETPGSSDPAAASPSPARSVSPKRRNTLSPPRRLPGSTLIAKPSSMQNDEGTPKTLERVLPRSTPLSQHKLGLLSHKTFDELFTVRSASSDAGPADMQGSVQAHSTGEVPPVSVQSLDYASRVDGSRPDSLPSPLRTALPPGRSLNATESPVSLSSQAEVSSPSVGNTIAAQSPATNNALGLVPSPTSSAQTLQVPKKPKSERKLDRFFERLADSDTEASSSGTDMAEDMTEDEEANGSHRQRGMKRANQSNRLYRQSSSPEVSEDDDSGTESVHTLRAVHRAIETPLVADKSSSGIILSDKPQSPQGRQQDPPSTAQQTLQQDAQYPDSDPYVPPTFGGAASVSASTPAMALPLNGQNPADIENESVTDATEESEESEDNEKPSEGQHLSSSREVPPLALQLQTSDPLEMTHREQHYEANGTRLEGSETAGTRKESVEDTTHNPEQEKVASSISGEIVESMHHDARTTAPIERRRRTLSEVSGVLSPVDDASASGLKAVELANQLDDESHLRDANQVDTTILSPALTQEITTSHHEDSMEILKAIQKSPSGARATRLPPARRSSTVEESIGTTMDPDTYQEDPSVLKAATIETDQVLAPAAPIIEVSHSPTVQARKSVVFTTQSEPHRSPSASPRRSPRFLASQPPSSSVSRTKSKAAMPQHLDVPANKQSLYPSLNGLMDGLETAPQGDPVDISVPAIACATRQDTPELPDSSQIDELQSQTQELSQAQTLPRAVRLSHLHYADFPPSSSSPDKDDFSTKSQLALLGSQPPLLTPAGFLPSGSSVTETPRSVPNDVTLEADSPKPPASPPARFPRSHLSAQSPSGSLLDSGDNTEAEELQNRLVRSPGKSQAPLFRPETADSVQEMHSSSSPIRTEPPSIKDKAAPSSNTIPLGDSTPRSSSPVKGSGSSVTSSEGQRPAYTLSASPESESDTEDEIDLNTKLRYSRGNDMRPLSNSRSSSQLASKAAVSPMLTSTPSSTSLRKGRQKESALFPSLSQPTISRPSGLTSLFSLSSQPTSRPQITTNGKKKVYTSLDEMAKARRRSRPSFTSLSFSSQPSVPLASQNPSGDESSSSSDDSEDDVGQGNHTAGSIAPDRLAGASFKREKASQSGRIPRSGLSRFQQKA